MHGYFDISLKMESYGNKINTITKGYTTVEFPEINEKITYSLPQSKILNAISQNDRSGYYLGVMNFVDQKNGLRGLVKFGENPEKIHEIRGYVIEDKFKKDYKFNYDEEYAKWGKLTESKEKEVKNIAACIIKGSWLEKIVMDDEVMWNIDEDLPTWIKPVKNCLPSDSRFREDLIWLFRSFYCSKNEEERAKYENLANEWKLMLEKLQRVEREHKAKQALERAKLEKNKHKK